MRIKCKVTLLAGVLAASLAALNAQAGLTHRYSFNTDAKDSVGTANATLMNGAGLETGFADNAYAGLQKGVHLNNVNGISPVPSSDATGQYVTLPPNVIAGATSLTFESWTDLGDVSFSSMPGARIFDVGNPSNGSGNDFLVMTPYSGKNPENSRIEFYINGKSQTAEGPADSQLTGYHHMMSVIDCTHGYMELYIDGALAARNTTTYQISNIVNNAFWLGRSEWGGDSYLYGYIDEFRIYNTALSALDAAADYSVGPDALPNVATTLGAIQNVYLSDPGPILESQTASTVATGDFANTSAATGEQFTGLRLFNAPGFTLTSSAPTVATVDAEGNIKALKPGTTTLTATYGGKSGTLVITVQADTVAPTIVSANDLGYDRLVKVTFSKPLNVASAQNVANYSIDQGVTVQRAVLDTNTMTAVSLYTSQFDPNATYTLTVNGVKDSTYTGNTVVGATINFAVTPGAPLTRRFYFTSAGYDSSSLANGMLNPGYPYSGGTTLSLVNGLSDTTGGHGDNYFSVVSGWLLPPTTDTYHFGLACDDNAAIYVSSDATEANLPTSATLQADGWSPAGHFTGTGGGETYTGANSVSLVAGNRYFFRALMRNGTGGDNFDVAWAPTSTPITDNMGSIPAAQLEPYTPPSIPLSVTGPTGLTISENYDASFTVVPTSRPVYTGVQWYQVNTNGTSFPILTNGNALTLVLSAVPTNMSGTKFYAVVSNLVDTVTSATATLTVTSDKVPPQVVLAKQVGAAGTNITVIFNERVTSNTAAIKGNYSLSPSVTILSVVFDSITKTNAYLTLSAPLAAGTSYTLTVNGVKDIAGNTIAANTKVVFSSYTFANGIVVRKRYYGFDDNSGTDPNNLFKDARYPNSPDSEEFTPGFEYPANNGGITGADAKQMFDTLDGYFTPPVSGDYVFFIAVCDRAWLFLSPDDQPANAVMICGQQGWCDRREWLSNHDLSPAPLDRSDLSSNNKWPGGSTINLQAGKRYYMQAVHHRPSWSGDSFLQATYKLATDPDPANGTASILVGNVLGDFLDPTGTSVTFTKQPTNASVMQGLTASFSAAATGVSPNGATILYQWQTAPKGSSTWTNIPGAITTTLATPILTLADSGRQYRMVATVPPVTQNSSVATVTVFADTTPPVPTVGAMLDNDGSTVDVGVGFDETVDNATGSAIENYTISSGTITSITWSTNRFTADSLNPLVMVVKQTALLTVSGFTGTSGTLTIRNVKDLHGNAITSVTQPFTVGSNMKWGVVGANEFGGWNSVVPVAANGWDIYSDGMTEWANYDETTFLYETITGDFDKKLRVQYQDGSSTWARAGLIARDVLNLGVDRATQTGGAAGRYQKIHVNPVGSELSGPGNQGNAAWEGNRRLVAGGQSDSAVSGINSTPLYPNAWCRLKREGQTFTIFRSDDGVNWVVLGSTTWGVTTPLTMPDTMYVGPEFTPENGNITVVADRGTFLAQIRDYGDYVADPQLKISVDSNHKVTVTWLTGTLMSCSTVNGTFTAVSGATSPYVVTPGSTPMFYCVK